MTASTERVSPLAQWAARFAAVSADTAAFTLRELPFATQLNLRGDSSVAAFRGVLGFDLPLTANTWTSRDDAAALWLGPDEWLVVAPEGRNESLCVGLRTALQGVHHAITDVSASRTIIELSGAHARLVLAKGCPLDLHGSALNPPHCAQTLLAKSQVIMQCIDGRPTFRIYVRNSFAPYVSEWLVDAAAELAASADLDTARVARSLA